MTEHHVRTEKARPVLSISEYCPPSPPAPPGAASSPAAVVDVPKLGERGKRVGIALIVGIVHLALGWLLLENATTAIPAVRSISPLRIITIARIPKQRIAADVTVQPILVDTAIVNQPTLAAAAEVALPTATTIHHGITIPPRPQTPLADSKSFAEKAGVPSGTGVTVVLRVEVYGNGSVGRVQIETSGGSRSVDEAAIAFVRSLNWIGGRIDNDPETIWIRWGVRLSA